MLERILISDMAPDRNWANASFDVLIVSVCVFFFIRNPRFLMEVQEKGREREKTETMTRDKNKKWRMRTARQKET